MDTPLPITLQGNTLGKRHNYLNDLVNRVHEQNVSFDTIKDLPESSAIDRLFKIDLAAKCKVVEYVMENLKEEDMLFVSKALKISWLYEEEYSEFINPVYLEETLYPLMMFTAVNKMKHAIEKTLKNERRCEDFYNYYKDNNNPEEGVRYLPNCSEEFISYEIVNVLKYMKPQLLKRLCERCSIVAKAFYDSINTDKTTHLMYSKMEKKYFRAVTSTLKIDPDIFFYIVEKYYSPNLNRLSAKLSDYILKNHMNKFNLKPELYTVWILNLNVLAKRLTCQDIKNIVVNLAQAKYLNNWFSYKNVEPLLKRLPCIERSQFKKQIFVDKLFKDFVFVWPYAPPSRPDGPPKEEYHLFSDVPYQDPCGGMDFRCMLKKRKYCSMRDTGKRRPITLLDQLFDKYRVTSFEKTLFELRQRMSCDSSGQNRQYMMLVLVSKSGGCHKNVSDLLRLLVEQHRNEPPTVRAAVVRSLVKRAAAWRLPLEIWQLLLQFAHGLGLDGKCTDVLCQEGLHAVVIRNILSGADNKPPVLAAFLQNFSSLTEYSLNPTERRCVCDTLLSLLSVAAESEPSKHLTHLLDTFDAYKVRADQYPGAVAVIVTAANRDPKAVNSQLYRLFTARVARRELFLENFSFIQTNDSYVNALRHDAELLATTDRFEQLLASDELRHDRYLRTLSIYFFEKSGLAALHLAALRRVITVTPDARFARPIARLAGATFLPLLQTLDTEPAGSAHRRLAAALRANAHVTRPPMDIDAVGWRVSGVKAVANRMAVCSAVKLDRYFQELLLWKRTARLAAEMVMRPRLATPVPSVLQRVGVMRPSAAVRAALRYLNRGDSSDLLVWDTVKPLIETLVFTPKSREIFRKLLENIISLPSQILPSYCVVIYKVMSSISWDKVTILLPIIGNILPEMEDNFISILIHDFLSNEFNAKTHNVEHFYYNEVGLNIAIKFVLLSEDQQTQTNRFDQVVEPILNCIENVFKVSKSNVYILNDFLSSLIYHRVFLDTNRYVSCLPVFEKILLLMRKFLPLHEYFEKYVQMHLTILYYKSIKYGLKIQPDILVDNVKKLKEGAELVGTIFGRYVSYEVRELITAYFASITTIYEEGLSFFLNNFKSFSNFSLFLESVIRGILQEPCNIDTLLLSYSIYKGHAHESQIIYEFLKTHTTEEFQFFLCGDDENV